MRAVATSDGAGHLQLEACLGGNSQPTFEELDAPFAPTLGAVHRDVGVAQHVVSVIGLIGANRNAHAGAGIYVVAIHLHRLVEGGHNALGNRLRIPNAVAGLDEDCEFVATQACRGVAVPEAGLDAITRGL